MIIFSTWGILNYNIEQQRIQQAKFLGTWEMQNDYAAYYANYYKNYIWTFYDNGTMQVLSMSADDTAQIEFDIQGQNKFIVDEALPPPAGSGTTYYMSGKPYQ